MNSRAVMLITWLGLIIPWNALAQENDVEASVSVSIQQQEQNWAGQQITVNLDLKTTGFSFSNTHFNLPEVSNAFLMQTDTTTIKLSEKKDGKDWQIIRYPLALYPQTSGLLKVPPFDVRFSTSAGYGSPVKDFGFQTEPMELMVTLPPGVNDGDIVVSTSSFQLDHSWQGSPNDAKTGDAFTLTVKRSASDISAMLLPPLPIYKTDGLGAYPQTPEINDRTTRGNLVGERSDSIIWVAEKAGNYEIPGIRFKWWDPVRQELKQQVIPGISLNITAAPGDRVLTGSDPLSTTQPGRPLAWLMLVIAAIVAGLVWRNSRKVTEDGHEADEKSAFEALQKACKNNHAGETYSALYAWLGWVSGRPEEHSRSNTLVEFARHLDDEQLKKDILHLQNMIITKPDQWKGQALLTSINRIRRNYHTQKTVQSRVHLSPLNP